MKIFRTIVVALALTSLTGVSVSASQEVSVKQYSVTPIFDELQDKEVKGYFQYDLGEETTYDSSLMFEVENKTDGMLTISMEVLDGVSSPNGVIQYSDVTEDTNYKLNDSAKKLSNYAVVEQILELNPKSKQVVEVPVKVEGLTGDIIGGISFTLIEVEEKGNKDQEQFKIINELKTIIAVVIKSNLDSNLAEEIVTSKPFVNTMPSYYAIRLPIDNQGDKLIEGLKLDYTVEDSSGNKLFESEKSLPLSITPKTKIQVPIDWNYPTIKSNHGYKLKATITSSNGSVVTKVEEEFKLTGNETVYGVNTEGFIPVEIKEDNPISLKEIGFALIGLLLIGLVIYVLFKYLKNKDELNTE